MPNVGPGLPPVRTCNGTDNVAPFSMVVTPTRVKVRPGFSAVQAGFAFAYM
jgi:hypothetical protein